MNRWKYQVNFDRFYHDTELSIKQKGEHCALMLENFLRAHPILDSTFLQEIIKTFKCIETTEGFDDNMTVLYDWADLERVWVKTI